MKKLDTVNYYNRNVKQFYDNTVAVDFTDTQSVFLSKLAKGSAILDFGCGSGRDTKYFLSQGHHVEAIDGSLELCKLASQYTGIQVRPMLFQELSVINKYDGIWACASILHLPWSELADVMRRMQAALKANGIIYTSFKYGTFSGERNGRYFTDMTEARFAGIIEEIGGLQIEEQWISADVRPGRGEEQWINIILRKWDMH